MNIRNILLASVCVAWQVAYSATPEATLDLQTVTVAAPAVRTDIRSACPGIDAQLQRLLSQAWGRVQHSASIPVQFRVEGNHVTQTRFAVASNDYGLYVRAAMANVDCEVAQGEGRDFRFLLVITDPDDRSLLGTQVFAFTND